MNSEILKARNAYREAIAENLKETGELKLLADDYDEDLGYPEGVLLSVPDKHFNLVDCVYNAIKVTEKGGIEVHICYFDDQEEEGWQSANDLSFDDFDILADAIQWPENITNGEHGDTLTDEQPAEDGEEDPTLTESQKRDTLCRLWDAAWQQAKADPEGTRVIVETNEADPTAPANEFGRYYMVDGSESESSIEHAGQWVVIRVDTVTSPYEVHRPNFAAAHGYSDNQTQLACMCENPNNVTRWARKMIDAGRVTDIYADCY